jgi:hypothetical protein
MAKGAHSAEPGDQGCCGQQWRLVGGAMPPQTPPDRFLAPLSTRTDRTTPFFSGEWEVGRLYQTPGGPDSLRWV